MSKQRKVFTCQNCGGQSPKWVGRCPDCGQWNAMVEETYQAPVESPATSAKGVAGVRAALGLEGVPVPVTEIEIDDTIRFQTAFAEFDRVLGGGVVPGSMVLIGGDPGIGKSTILMQALSSKLLQQISGPILYVSGEESGKQIKLRAERLGCMDPRFLVYAENCFEKVFEQIQKLKPALLIIDSIQTLYSSQVMSAPGSVSQIRECTGKLLGVAKSLGVATFIVGHITKEGSIAGPKVLEHMVDCVLYFENSSSHTYRILRAVKNRFGSTNEIGVFEMHAGGLREVQNPSELFLQERPINTPGTVVVAAIEGTRPLLVEVQALVSSSNLGVPRRTTLGVDHNKVSLIVAILEKKIGVPLYGHDIFVNIAGGIELTEPATDLAVALALLSSFRNQALPSKLFVCGEVGLAGEIRHISNLEQRLTEGEKMGFQYGLVPKTSLERFLDGGGKLKRGDFHVLGTGTLSDAVDQAFELTPGNEAVQRRTSESTRSH